MRDVPGKLLVAAIAILISTAVIAETAASDAASTESAFAIDTENSWLRVLVYRAGLLGGLGHNHVVSHHALSGSVEFDQATQSASVSLSIPVADFVIDDPALRVAEGDDFPGEMKPKDIAGTRKNMLGRKLLDAERFATIAVRSTAGIADTEITATVTIKGRDWAVRAPVAVEPSEGTWSASGEVSVSHADLGLKPFKAALGALRVQDSLTIKFKIVADAPSLSP